MGALLSNFTSLEWGTQLMFEENQHYRSRVGRFAPHELSAPEVGLVASECTLSDHDGGDKNYEMSDLIDGPAASYRPLDQQELHEALDASDMLSSESNRRVEICDGLLQLNDIDVRGPFGGGTLCIDVTGLTGSFNVLEGRVIIKNNSPHHIDVSARGDADVTVIVARRRYSTVEAHDTSNVLVLAERGARGSLRMASSQADGDVLGDTSNFFNPSIWSWDL